VTDNDSVIADEDILDDQPHDSLAFDDIQGIGGAAQAAEERGEGFCKPQEVLTIVGLVGDRLQLGAQLLFAVSERGHALAQLFEREQIFLIRSQYSSDTFTDTDEFSLQTLFALFGWVRGTRGQQTTVQFLLDQCGIFKQSDDFAPDDLIEQILPHRPAIAYRTGQSSPAVGAQASIIFVRWCR
jgi:hypothetical protein